jgi:hypothetical protein
MDFAFEIRRFRSERAAIPSSDESGASWNKGGGSAVLWLNRINRDISRESVMKKNAKERLAVRLRRAAVALVAIVAVAAGTVHASPPNPVVVVSPADIPALARQTGDATLLHETADGRILLYIEQNQGARLATVDVTDPLHDKGEGSVYLDSSAPFDFVSPVENQAELVQFRQGQEDAVLDLPRAGVAKLMTAQGLPLPGPMTDALTVTHPMMDAAPAVNFGPIDTVLSYELNRMFDVKQVRAQMTRTDTGTTFMLTEDGLCVIRRPVVEWLHQLMETPPN